MPQAMGWRLGLVLALLATAVLANAAIGAVAIAPGLVLQSLVQRLGLIDMADIAPGQALILWSIRLPRLVVGILVGAGLAVAGALMQAVFRNPLAEPGLTGISAGAAVAAAAVIVLGGGIAGSLTLPPAAFAGALAAFFAVYVIARSAGPAQALTLILAGVAVNALAWSLLGYLTFISDDTQLRNLTFWTMGSLGGSTWAMVPPLLVLVGGGVAVACRLGGLLNLYQLGEAEAGHLGIDAARLRIGTMGLAAVIVGACIAVSGQINFLGLVVPHLVRLWQGPDHRALLPMSALTGAVLILSADLVARTIIAPAELPIGLVTAFIGAPFFIYLLVRQTRMAGH